MYVEQSSKVKLRSHEEGTGLGLIDVQSAPPSGKRIYSQDFRNNRREKLGIHPIPVALNREDILRIYYRMRKRCWFCVASVLRVKTRHLLCGCGMRKEKKRRRPGILPTIHKAGQGVFQALEGLQWSLSKSLLCNQLP